MASLAPAALERAVPACPGWDVAEVMRHTASVYGNKTATIRLGRQPEQGEWRARPPEGTELVVWFRQSLDALLGELVDHDPDDPAYTWWPADQTIGFWYRRMALETVVHRVDVEMAANDVSPVDAALAVDGVDEVLTVFLQARQQPDRTASTGTVAVTTADEAWTVHLDSAGVRVERGDDTAASAQLTGPPGPLFLYLWGRGTLVGLDAGGDGDLVLALRRRLAAATQ